MVANTSNPLSTLIDALSASKSFEDAATATLAPMLDITTAAVAASRFAAKGKILRAMVHLRPDDGYRGIAVFEQGARQAMLVGQGADVPHASALPSASAWRWVSERGSAAAIDVHTGRVEMLGAVAATGAQAPDQESLGRESTMRLLERSSTHLYATPLHTPAGIAGMISLEAECRAAMGRPFVWAECAEALREIAFVAAPYLASRPIGAARTVVDPLLPVVGASMAPLVEIARVFATQEETLLVMGPTGAGKSRFARYCHSRSPRRDGPFEVIDLLSIPDELQMGELFGWRRGAFSGAALDNPGALARADRGTLFLDEIDKLTLKAQAGLLHVLEERRYRPLGEGAGDRRADVRFLVGTNANLMAAVKAGRFREDLYYRINVLPLRLPSLDERADEIGNWAEYMLGRRHAEHSVGGEARIAKDAIALLERRRWPGSLRQLDNVIRRAYALALVEMGGVTCDVVLEERHLAQAVGYEAGEEAQGLSEALLVAARVFVREAERRAEKGEPLDLDLVDGLRGLVLGTAAQKVGNVESALRLLGKGAAVEHRNHKKIVRREVDRVAELYRAIGAEPPPFLRNFGEK